MDVAFADNKFSVNAFGWPCLGAINKQKQVTISTVASALVQVIILLLLIFVDKFTLVGIAMARIVSEFVLLTIRLIYCYMYRKEFLPITRR